MNVFMELQRLSLRCVFAWVLLSHGAFAVVVSDTTGNAVAPLDDPGWNHVGLRGSGSGVHIAEGWVLTAAHVGAGPIHFPSGTFLHDPDSVVRLTNPSGSGLSPETDLMLFRLTDTPVLPPLDLSVATPALGTEVTLIGAGRNRQGSLTHWDVTPVAGDNNDVWKEVSDPGTHSGFKTSDRRDMQWGMNVVSRNNFDTESGWGDVLSFETKFDNVFDIVGEAQATRGDSGGAAFQKIGSTWVLSGLIHAVDLKENQPGGTNTAVFGNATFIADISAYQDQINAIVTPEPTGNLLGIVGWGILFRHRSGGRRDRRRRR